MAPALSNPNPILDEEEEKLYPTISTAPSKHRKLQRRRRFIVFFGLFALTLLLFARPPETIATPFSTVIATVQSWFSCHSEDMSALHKSVSHDATGWHARALEHAKTATTAEAYEPKKEDLVVSVLISTPVEPEGFTMALFKSSHIVDASGRIINVASSDGEAFEALVAKVKELSPSGNFEGQWRVNHDRTDFPIDRILIPGHPEVSVYGWSKKTTALEEETAGETHLPEALQTLVGLAKEAREGYKRGQRDEAVVSKVLAFSN